jgi:prepilin-type N-terminal cleavage/methylation domain-containing protein
VPAVEAVELGVVSRHPLATVAVVAGIEALLAMAFVVMPRSRLAPAGVIVVFGIFTAFLFMLGRVHDAPGCGCLGILFPSGDAKAETTMGVVRNAGLILVAFWLLIQSGQRPDAALVPIETTRKASVPNARWGFTLIEMLVCISIIAVLISLAAPALRASRS